MFIDKECFIFTMAAWQSTVPKTTHFISNWPETVVDVNGANFAGTSVAVLVTTVHIHIILRGAITPNHVTVCNSL